MEKESPAKKSFKLIISAAFTLKLITILSLIALIISVSLIAISTKTNEQEIEESQIVAELEYTDDVQERPGLDTLQNFYNIKIYDEDKAHDNIIMIWGISTLNCIFELILVIFIFNGVQKLFTNLYKNEDGLVTDENAKIMKNIGFSAILKLLIPAILNIITHYMLASTIRGKITVIQIVFTLVIIITSFATYYDIKSKQ